MLHCEYPTLPLALIDTVIAFYPEKRAEVDEYMSAVESRIDKFGTDIDPAPACFVFEILLRNKLGPGRTPDRCRFASIRCPGTGLLISRAVCHSPGLFIVRSNVTVPQIVELMVIAGARQRPWRVARPVGICPLSEIIERLETDAARINLTKLGCGDQHARRRSKCSKKITFWE